MTGRALAPSTAASYAFALLLFGCMTLFAAGKRETSGEMAFTIVLIAGGIAGTFAVYLRNRVRVPSDERLALAGGVFALLTLTMVVGGATGSTFSADVALGVALVAVGAAAALPVVAYTGVAIAAVTLAMAALGAPETVVPVTTGGLLVAGGFALRRTSLFPSPATAEPVTTRERHGVRELPGDLRREAAQVCADAFLHDPAMVALVPRAEGRRRAMLAGWFAGLLRIVRLRANRPPSAAVVGGRLAGVCWAYEPGRYPAPGYYDLLMPAPLLAGPRGALRAARWAAMRNRNHPRQPHLYLETIAVAPQFQGSGVGTALLSELCDEADRRGLDVVLHTNTAANVRYYRRFGFLVKNEMTTPAGAPEWLLRRPV